MARRIIIADYDPDWPHQFEILKERFSTALGELAVAIEHVGSTSVPGLAAKPVIDVAMVVPSTRNVPEGIRRLAKIGYTHRGDLGVAGREAFDTPPDTYPHHPYLHASDSRELRRHIAFGDRLWRDEKVRNEYEHLKRALAARLVHMVPEYWESKTELVERVLAEELGPDH